MGPLNFGGGAAGTPTTLGRITSVNGVATAGNGIPTIMANARSVGIVNLAVASVATFTVGAADGTFKVCGNINLTASVTNSITMTCAYTDENNTGRTVMLSFIQNGVLALIQTITNVTGVGAYSGIPTMVRCKAGTTITLATVGTFTSVTYNVEGAITQWA